VPGVPYLNYDDPGTVVGAGRGPNGRSGFWMNSAIGVNALTPGTAGTGHGTSNNLVCNNTTGGVIANAACPGGGAAVSSIDFGVGGGTTFGVTYEFHAAPVTVTAAGSFTTAAAAAPVTSLTELGESVTNQSFCAVSQAMDALGNKTLANATGSSSTTCKTLAGLAGGRNIITFGDDFTPPTITLDDETAITAATSLAASARLNGATVGNEFRVLVNDFGPVAVSGMAPVAPVTGSVLRRNAAGTTCVVGTGGGCAQAALAGIALPNVSTTTIAASATPGFLTFSATAFDAAGNSTALAGNRVVVWDAAANTPVLTTASYPVPITGTAVTFSAFGSDNLDLWKVDYNLAYAGGLANPIIYPTRVLNPFNQSPLMNSGVEAGITPDGFFRQIENVTNAAGGPLGVGGAFKPATLSGTLTDVATNVQVGAPTITAIPGAAVTTGVSYTAAAASQLTRDWRITLINGVAAAATSVSNGNPAACVNANPVNPLSVSFTAQASGPTASYNQPFTRVDWYINFGGFLNLIGTSSSASLNDDGSAFGRVFSYSLTWTPGNTFGCALAGANIYAVGINAAGDALVTPVNTNVSITNP
jgi:hypothetical protein